MRRVLRKVGSVRPSKAKSLARNLVANLLSRKIVVKLLTRNSSAKLPTRNLMGELLAHHSVATFLVVALLGAAIFSCYPGNLAFPTAAQAETYNPEGIITVHRPPTPDDGSTVYGNITIHATAHWPQGLVFLQLWQGKTMVHAVDNGNRAAPVELAYDFNTATVPDGPVGFTLLALVYINGMGYPRYVDLNFNVLNVGPVFTWESPGDDARVAGTVDVKAQVTDAKNMNITRVQTSLDDTALNDMTLDVPQVPYDFEYSWDTTRAGFGEHTLKIEAWIELGERAEATRTVCWANLSQVESQFYFAEGTTLSNFRTYLCLGNPAPEPVNVVVDFQTRDGVMTKGYQVGAGTRRTVDVNDETGIDKDVSMGILADGEIICERPMYFNYKNAWTGGSDAMGAPVPSKTWYFAEGTTRTGFDSYLCLQNPDNTETAATLNFMVANEGLRPVPVPLPPCSRTTINVMDHIGREKDFSVKV